MAKNNLSQNKQLRIWEGNSLSFIFKKIAKQLKKQLSPQLTTKTTITTG